MLNNNKKKLGYTTNNKVQLLYSGKPYFDKLLSLIQQAKHSIHLQIYIFDEDETGNQIAKELMAAAQRGVAVYLMPDGYASKNLSDNFINKLTESGINFRYFEPLLKSENFYFGRRLHHKITVVDGYFSLVTGNNISNKYNDMPNQPAWMDWGVYAEGDISKELYEVCLQVWSKINKLHKKPVHTTIANTITEKCLVRVRRNDWVKRYNQISRSYMDMISTASSHVVIMSSYFIPGWFIRKRLSNATKRGVKIKVIVTGVSDVLITKAAECYMYRWLHKKNIEVYEYTSGVLHSKLSTKDSNWVTVGSYNVNNLSAYASVELNLDIADEAFAKSTEKELKKIIKEDCILVTPELYEHRYNFIKKSLQFLSYLTVRVMINVSTFYFKQKN